MAFPINARVKVEIASGILDSSIIGEGFRERDIDAVPFAGMVPSFNSYPSVIGEFLASGYGVSISSDGIASIIGVEQDPITEASALQGPRLETQTIGFRKVPVSDDQIEALSPFFGYPLQIKAKAFFRVAADNILDGKGWLTTENPFIVWNNETGEITNNSFDLERKEERVFDPNTGTFLPDPKVTITRISYDEVVFTCFLGALNETSSAFALLNSNGEELDLSKMSFRNVPIVRPLDNSNFEKLARNAAPGVRASAADLAANAFVNGVSRILVVNMQGRVDTSGIVQPDIEGFDVGSEGPIPVRTGFPFSQPFTDFKEGVGRVIHSEVTQSLIDRRDGFVISPSRHRLILEVGDRSALGIGSTPSVISESRYPQARVNGRSFYITSMDELFERRVRITFESISDA